MKLTYEQKQKAREVGELGLATGVFAIIGGGRSILRGSKAFISEAGDQLINKEIPNLKQAYSFIKDYYKTRLYIVNGNVEVPKDCAKIETSSGAIRYLMDVMGTVDEVYLMYDLEYIEGDNGAIVLDWIEETIKATKSFTLPKITVIETPSTTQKAIMEEKVEKLNKIYYG